MSAEYPLPSENFQKGNQVYAGFLTPFLARSTAVLVARRPSPEGLMKLTKPATRRTLAQLLLRSKARHQFANLASELADWASLVASISRTTVCHQDVE